MRRRGLGHGQGRGYRNIIPHFDSRVHQMSGKGVKQPQKFSKSVTLSPLRKRHIQQKMFPLLEWKVISGYNIADRPLGKHRHVVLIYGHNVAAHGVALLQLLKDMKVKHEVMPRESVFIDSDVFVKTKGQVREGDVVQAKEYEIWFDGSPKVLNRIERFMRKRAVNRGNPKAELPESYTTPDIRLKSALRHRNFRVADEIRKPLDRNTDLVILSVRPINTTLLRKLLTNERVSQVQVQDYRPRRHSLHDYIEDKTENVQ